MVISVSTSIFTEYLQTHRKPSDRQVICFKPWISGEANSLAFMKSMLIHHIDTTRAANLWLKWVLGRGSNYLSSFRHTVTIHMSTKNSLHTHAHIAAKGFIPAHTQPPPQPTPDPCATSSSFYKCKKIKRSLERKQTIILAYWSI